MESEAPLGTFALKCFAIAALWALARTLTSSASAETLVKFDSALPRQAAVNRDGENARPPARKPDIQGYLTGPKGDGPFPAVVLLHSCLGLPADKRSLAAMFADWGYVALFVDDFATRGIRETCAVEFKQALSDAYGALAFVARLPYVDPARIAAIGFSQGADTALESPRGGSPPISRRPMIRNSRPPRPFIRHAKIRRTPNWRFRP